MHSIRVALGARSYNIYIGAGLLSQVGAWLQRARLGTKLVIITNPTVFELYGYNLKEALLKDGFEVAVLTVPDGEEYKSLQSAGQLYTELSDNLAERQTPVLALGGGVIGDLAGFVAATYMRGMPLLHLPTTLLAQVDSSVGGKTGVNHGKLKNQIGTFYQPRAVFSDTGSLKTLPAGQLANGLAEVIKSAVIRDRNLFRLLERSMDRLLALDDKIMDEAVLRTAAIKAAVVSRDERDSGLRHILNFGHTIGHALETVTDFRIGHGEAVAIGMIKASQVSHRLGLLPERELARLVSVISSAGLPTTMPEIDRAAIMQAIKHDKKVTGGKTRFILPVRIGQVIITNKVEPSLVEEVLTD